MNIVKYEYKSMKSEREVHIQNTLTFARINRGVLAPIWIKVQSMTGHAGIDQYPTYMRLMCEWEFILVYNYQ